MHRKLPQNMRYKTIEDTFENRNAFKNAFENVK